MDWAQEPPDPDLVSSSDWTSQPPDEDLKVSPGLLSKAGSVGMGALETINAPFQVAGEAIRGAGESEPLRVATADNPRGFRAPSIVQRMVPSLRTSEPPADPFQKAYQGLEGIANLPRGIQAASDVVTGPPDVAAQLGGFGMALGLMPPKAGVARERPGIPGNVAREPLPGAEVPPEPPPLGAGMPPGGGSRTPPPSETNPLEAVEEYLGQKYKRTQETAGLPHNLGKALEQRGRGMRLKEIGAFPGQVRQLKQRFGEQVVNDLADLAEKKGISKGFFNWQTGEAIKRLDQTSGQNIGALRDMAAQRGAVHDKAALLNQIRTELDPLFLKGTRSGQKGAYLKALQDIQNSPPDAASMANTITGVNKYIAKNKLVLPLGATKEVMKVANRLNNEKISQFLNPQEVKLYEDSLKDATAAKIFDKMYGYTYGRDMAGRTGPGGIVNFFKDVGGRKIMEKVYSKLGRGMQKMTGGLPKPKALASDVLDAVDEALDEMISQMGSQPPEGMAHGGIVGEMDSYLTPKYGGAQ